MKGLKMVKKKRNYYEMSDWEKKHYKQLTIEDALNSLNRGGGERADCPDGTTNKEYETQKNGDLYENEL